MLEQQNSWNTGDIEGFMQWYWKNDSLKFVSKNGISYGWQKVLDNYKKGYPTQEKMGTLKFDLLHISEADQSATVVGKWKLSYSSKADVGGYFTLLWMKKKEGWRIVIDHTS